MWYEEDGYKVFNAMVEYLYEHRDELDGNAEFWSDGERLLCKDEAKLNAVADLFDCMTPCASCTGYYDPHVDSLAGTVDDHTGYYYLELA